MATYCKEGDKPIVKYRLGNDTKDRIFKSKFAPIEVNVKAFPLKASDNFDNNGFGLSWQEFSGSAPTNVIAQDYKVWAVPPGDITVFRISVLNCGLKWNNLPRDTNARPYTDGYGSFYLFNPSTIVIDRTKKCSARADERCSIEVTHKGIVLFQDQGNCPVSFSVQCGKCPTGQHECESKTYPYYCCNDCAGTARKINNIASKIRG